MDNNISENLVLLEFLQRENETKHHTYDDDMLQYEYIKKGDLESVNFSKKLFLSENVGHLSDNPLRNCQYHFICATTLATRFAIEGGMHYEDAYNLSDAFIQSMDKLKTIEEIKKVHSDMIKSFTLEVKKRKKTNYDKKIVECMDYIYYRLHTTISVNELAKKVKLNPSYLSVLFKKETGETISEYIRKKRIEAAQNMLVLSNYSLSEISEFLAFSSYSHFAKVFYKYNKMTPKEYQKAYFHKNKIED